MRVERILEAEGRVGLWLDVGRDDAARQGQSRLFIGHEQPPPGPSYAADDRAAICWAYEPTIGNIETINDDVLSQCQGGKGIDVVLPCDLVAAGRMRNGVPRWWCRTHQRHWGSAADLLRALSDRTAVCAGHDTRLSYVIGPPSFDVADHAEIGVWCSMPPALTSKGVAIRRRPKVHVHVRESADGPKVVDRDFAALRISYDCTGDLFAGAQKVTVPITPPAALEFVLALERGTPMDCIACRDCGAPHLDMGEFARIEHVKHLCGNCGRDNTRSHGPVASTPLKPLHDAFDHSASYVDADRRIDLDAYPGASWALWASTPAVMWTAARAQERGIHVHLGLDGRKVVDDTFSEVVLGGRRLDRTELLEVMVRNTVA